MARVKVLHVESGMHLYGGARQVLSLLDALRGSDIENVLVCAAGSDLEREARARGAVRVRALPMAGDLDPLLWWRLLRAIRDEMPTIVHLHSRRGADVQGGIAARLAGVRTVLSRRVDHAPSRVLLERRYRLYDRVIAISAEIRRVLADAGVPASKLVCVPSAVEAERFEHPVSHAELCTRLGLAPQAVVVGVVAQLIPRKGHRELVRMFPAVLAAEPHATLVFFGRGPLEGDLRAQARELGIADHVVLAGFRTDVPELMGALDLVVHPAITEGLGVALLEAAAARRPIVATAAGGIPEIIRDGETGLLVPPRDADALARAVLRLLANPALGRRLGEAARNHVAAQFSVAAMAAGNLSVYRELAGG